MIKFVLSAAASFTLASLAALPATAYTLPERPTAAPSVSVGKFTVANLPLFEGAIAVPLSGGNLAVNGSFETGDLSGWTQVNDTSFSGVSGEFAGVPPTDGNFQGFFGPIDPGGGGILQQIATTSGGVYELTFDLANLSGGANAFGLFWDGSFVSIDFEVEAFPYTNFTTNLTATGTDTTLGFIFYHSPSYWLLDNVSLSVVPEPSSWAMLIAGFGLTGAVMRRQRSNIVAA